MRFGFCVGSAFFDLELQDCFAGADRSVREIRGYGSSTSNRTAVLVTIIHANKKLAPVQAELIKAAMSIVPALGI